MQESNLRTRINEVSHIYTTDTRTSSGNRREGSVKCRVCYFHHHSNDVLWEGLAPSRALAQHFPEVSHLYTTDEQASRGTGEKGTDAFYH